MGKNDLNKNDFTNDDFGYFEALFDASNEGLWVMKPDGHVKFFNKQFYKRFNVGLSESSIDEWQRLIHPDDRKGFDNNLAEQTENHIKTYISEYRVKQTDGHYVWIEAKGVAIFNGDGQMDYMVGSHSDISERKLNEAKMYKLAYYDRLTGLLNRSALLEILEERRAMQMLYFNLSKFRIINDTFGYERANDVLRLFAETLMRIFQDDGDVYRVDADEFAVIVPIDFEIDLIKKKILILKDTFKRDLSKFSTGLDINLNIGRALSNQKYGESLIEQAKWAMLYGKKMGLDHCIDFNVEILEHTKRSFFMETGINQSLQADEFYMTFQPIIDKKTGRIICFEALMRWKNQTYGFISPSEFIPISEKTRDIIFLGKFAVNAAFEMMCKIKKTFCIDIPIAINISAIQLFEPDFYYFILEQMAQYQISGKQIVFEITETVALEVTSKTSEIINRFKALGIVFALDDFGSGYSSLSTLLNVPFDYVKIDKRIVQNIVEDEEVKAFVNALGYLCHTKGLYVVGEGIETESMRESMVPLAIDYLQGFYFAMPLDQVEVIAYLEERLTKCGSVV